MAKRPTDINDPEMLSELGCVPMSTEALAKMSLNPYDQLFICRLMTLRDEAAKEELYRAVAEVVAAQNKMMFSSVAEQTAMIKNIAKDITDIKKDITSIKGRLADVEDQAVIDERKQMELAAKLMDLEKEVKVLKPELVKTLIEKVEEVEPTLEKVVKYTSIWQTLLRIMIGIGIGYIIFYYVHKFFWS